MEIFLVSEDWGDPDTEEKFIDTDIVLPQNMAVNIAIFIDTSSQIIMQMSRLQWNGSAQLNTLSSPPNQMSLK
jgi:hypothetical protein